MAKKRQTTGLPKSTPKTPENPAPTPETGTSPIAQVNRALGRGQGTQEYRSRAERETEIQSLVIFGTLAAIAIVVIVLLVALAYDGIYRPNQAAATVNGETINIGEFQRRVKLERAISIERINNVLNNRIAFTGQTPDEVFGEIYQQDETFTRWWDELRFPDTIGLRVLDDMIDDRFIAAEAEKRGITVSEEDIDKQIDDFLGYNPEEIALIGVEPTATPEPTITPTPFVSPTPSPIPTETPTSTPEPTIEATEGAADATADATGEATTEATSEATISPTEGPTFTPAPTASPVPTLSREEVEENYRDVREAFLADIRRAAGVSDDDLRSYFRAVALRRAVSEALVGDTENATYIDFRRILVFTEEEAQDVINALEAGESFADLAQAVSQDEAAQNGGEVGTRGIFELQAELVDLARDGAIGETLGPVQIEDGWVIMQIRSRETQELDEFDKDTVLGRALTEWLEAQRKSEENTFETYDTWTANVPTSPVFLYEPR